MREFLVRFWEEVRAYWKSEILPALVIGLLTISYLVHSNQYSGAAAVWANVRAVLFGCLFTFALVVLWNLAWTLYLNDRRAAREKEKRREAEEDARIANRLKPRPNIVFDKLDLVPIEYNPAKDSIRIERNFNRSTPPATIVVFRNQILETGHEISTAVYAVARIAFVPGSDSSSVQESFTVNAGYWLNSGPWIGVGGRSIHFDPGEVQALVLCFDSDGNTFTAEMAHGGMMIQSLEKGRYDVLLTITCGKPTPYVARFHLKLDTQSLSNSSLCPAPKSCAFCEEHRVANTN